jgi:hypothetical protein
MGRADSVLSLKPRSNETEDLSVAPVRVIKTRCIHESDLRTANRALNLLDNLCALYSLAPIPLSNIVKERN